MVGWTGVGQAPAERSNRTLPGAPAHAVLDHHTAVNWQLTGLRTSLLLPARITLQV